ncbi:radical SAM/SPASM domain-containing protein [Ruminococcus flavefaciens]|uniref:radical SAM/SPASM domain-containing protein n=1 Tax=Ruminococcus flavefaciens TaxID=1265 RepID=UPI0026EBFE48|nr:radical SAM protein [Ruminococcus flavefaciens]MDD7515898.1 radical SAM protein [Ruminococcus flavefaciens]MDY5691779.1 radical SAM protein [Ruminococcus flavefaciens]
MQNKKIKHVMQWHITHRCNLRCSHCYQEEFGSELSFNELEKLFYQYMDFCDNNSFRGHINFTGGEPLLSEHLFPLLELCNKNDVTFGLLSNGTLIDDKIAEKLQLFNGLSFVQVSIDGTEKTHDSVRGNGNFKKAISGLQLLKKHGIQTMAAFTCHKRNYTELKDVIRIIRKNKIDRFWADRLVPIGGSCEDALSNEEYRSIIKLLTKEHGRKCLFSNTDVHLNRSLQFLEGGNCYYQCAAGKTLLTLLADGTLLPCRRLPVPIGNCLEEDMSALYEKSELIKELSEQKIPKECLPCPHALLCRGGAKCITYAFTGDFRGRDINCYYKY